MLILKKRLIKSNQLVEKGRKIDKSDNDLDSVFVQKIK